MLMVAAPAASAAALRRWRRSMWHSSWRSRARSSAMSPHCVTLHSLPRNLIRYSPFLSHWRIALSAATTWSLASIYLYRSPRYRESGWEAEFDDDFVQIQSIRNGSSKKAECDCGSTDAIADL